MRGAVKIRIKSFRRQPWTDLRIRKEFVFDWEFVDQRDAANAKRLRDAAAKRNLAALRSGVKGATIGPELSDYLWENTRSRTPDVDDRAEVKRMLAQGFSQAAICCGLELTQERVAQALASWN